MALQALARATIAIVVVGCTLMTAPGSTRAQAGLTRVTLKSNEVLQGTVLTEQPDGGVRMALLDGTVVDVPAASIASIWRPSLDDLRAAPDPNKIQRANEVSAAPPPPSPRPIPEAPDERPDERAASTSGSSDLEGWYGGGYAGGAVAPAFPGVAGVGGVEGLLGYRSGLFEIRLGLGGFGAAFPIGSLGFVTVRPEALFWVAGPYGLGVGAGPLVGYYEDESVGGGVMGGAMFSATPVALRFDAGGAVLEGSLAAGAVVGAIEQADGIVARPYLLLGFAASSR